MSDPILRGGAEGARAQVAQAALRRAKVRALVRECARGDPRAVYAILRVLEATPRAQGAATLRRCVATLRTYPRLEALRRLRVVARERRRSREQEVAQGGELSEERP